MVFPLSMEKHGSQTTQQKNGSILKQHSRKMVAKQHSRNNLCCLYYAFDILLIFVDYVST